MANEQYVIKVVLDGQDDLSQPTNRARENIRDLSDEAEKGQKHARSFGESWSSFKDHAASFVGAGALVIGTLAKINELGTEANAAERTFNQVSGGVDEATASLGRMREMTGGVIDDMSLMKGASSLLVTGIADTNQQAEELVNLGARLSAVMGVDATEGIANLNSALLNNSFLRLDTLGISASAVRERVNELKEAGYDMSEAFSQAVIEIGTQTLADLGDAANVAETAVARLSTRFQNLAQDLSQGFAIEVEKVATTIEQLLILGDIAAGNSTGNAAIDAQIAKQEELLALAEQYQSQYADRYMEQGYQFEDIGISAGQAESFLDNNASMAPALSTGTYFQDAFASLDPARIAEARAAIEQLNPQMAALSDTQLRIYALELDTEFLALAEAEADLEAQTTAANRSLEAQAIALGIEARAAEVLSASLDRTSEATGYAELEQRARTTKAQAIASEIEARAAQVLANERSAEIEGFASGILSSAIDSAQVEYTATQMTSYIALQDEAASGMRALTVESENLNASFAKGTMIMGEHTFFDPAQLGEVQSQANALVDEYERLSEFSLTHPELISEEELNRAKEIADSATQTANEAERNAQAWENASLAMIAGASSGGREDEFYQRVLGNIEDPEARAALEHQFNLQSGVETVNTMVTDYAEALTTALVTEFGSGRGAQLGQEVYLALEAGIAAGLEGQALKDFIEQEVGYSLSTVGGGQEVTVQAGEGYDALAQRTGIAKEDIMAATGGRMLLAGEVITVGDGTSLIAVSGDPQETINSTIDGLFANASAAIGASSASTSSSSAPMSDYTYYDPATGSYTYANDPTAEESAGMAAEGAQRMISEEDVAAAESIQSDMLDVETSMSAISTYDLTTVVDPMLADMVAANEEMQAANTTLTALTSANWRVTIPVDIALGTQTAEMLARNPTIIQAVNLIVDSGA